MSEVFTTAPFHSRRSRSCRQLRTSLLRDHVARVPVGRAARAFGSVPCELRAGRSGMEDLRRMLLAGRARWGAACGRHRGLPWLVGTTLPAAIWPSRFATERYAAAITA